MINGISSFHVDAGQDMRLYCIAECIFRSFDCMVVGLKFVPDSCCKRHVSVQVNFWS